MTLLLSLQHEWAEIKQKGEDEMRAMRQKNEDELRVLKQQNEMDLLNLQQENEEMKKKLLGDKAEKTKLLTTSGQSKVNTLHTEKEDEGSYQMGETSNLDERRHPFVDRIINVELPATWRGFSIDRYDDTTNPEEHIDVYTTDVGLFTTNEAIMCRIFPSFLKGMALSWFIRLPPYSINSFKTLVNLFIIQFATSKSHHLTSLALVNIRQERGESLWVFMDRFGQVALQIRNLNPKVALHHMITALRSGPFANSLCKKPALNLNEMRVRATKFMRLEDLRDFGGQMKSEPQAKRTKVRERVTFPPLPLRPKEIKIPRFLIILRSTLTGGEY